MKNLKIIRKNQKMTQQQVATFLGISRSTYTQYETGSSEPNFETLNKLADFFDVPTAFFLESPPFDNFEQLIPHIDLLYHSVILMLGDSFKHICPSPVEHLNVLISIISCTVNRISLNTSTDPIQITIYPSLPLEKMKNVLPMPGLELTPDEEKLIEDYRTFNAEGQEKIRDYIADLSDSPRYKKCSDVSIEKHA